MNKNTGTSFTPDSGNAVSSLRADKPHGLSETRFLFPRPLAGEIKLRSIV
jgi:hypothetical protein